MKQIKLLEVGMCQTQNLGPADYRKFSTVRNAESAAATAQAKTALEAYWTGSASASILRDYEAGRVTHRKVRQPQVLS